MISAQIVYVLSFLHKKKVIYRLLFQIRDLKPENLLIDSDGNIKLIDFGYSKIMDNDKTYTLCGT